MKVSIEDSWKQVLKNEFDQAYFASLVTFLKAEKEKNKIIYPAGKDIFKAFELTPFHKVKVVILGQDPYHNPHQAHGLSFSVQTGIAIPPSLINIFKELENDIGKAMPISGDLSHWAEQGVLLLNASLTVEANSPMSHSNIGWHLFTDAIIQKLSEQKEHLVFILWGKFAQSKQTLIDPNKHFIIKSVHPSPLSAYRGFLGSKPFSQTNEYLKANNIPTINW